MGDSNVRVGVRVRPLLGRELTKQNSFCIRHPTENQILVGADKRFTLNNRPRCNYAHTSELYGEALGPLLAPFLEGFNVTVLAYGQTGSGKTYTIGSMDGGMTSNQKAMENKGIISRFLDDLFEYVEKNKDRCTATVSASFLEIYGEDIRDLLPLHEGYSSSLKIREDSTGVWVDGLRQVPIASCEDAMECLRSGSVQRSTGATLMNAESSRSHAVFTVTLTQKICQKSADASEKFSSLSGPENAEGQEDDMETHICSKLTFVDLAGSERLKRTQAEGTRMKEGININVGLLALGNVINCLSDDKRLRSAHNKGSGAENGSKDAPNSPAVHVPYRSSKLTRLLQDALGGNSKTLFIACVSPAEDNLSETINTLRYANRARNIQNKAVKNVDAHSAELLRLRQLAAIFQLELVKAVFASQPSVSDEDVKRMLQREEVKTYLQTLAKKAGDLKQDSLGLTMDFDKKAWGGSSASSTSSGARSKNRGESVDNATKAIQKLGRSLLSGSTSSSSSSFPSSSKLTKSLGSNGASQSRFGSTRGSETDKAGGDGGEGGRGGAEDEAEEDDEEDTLDEDLLLLDELLDLEKRESEHASVQLQGEAELAEMEAAINSKEKRLMKVKERMLQLKEVEARYAALQLEVGRLEEEQSRLLEELGKKTSGGNRAEQKRRLDTVNSQLADLKREQKKQRQLIIVAKREAARVKSLEDSIQRLKEQKTQLIRKHRDQALAHRKWTEKKNKEILLLKKSDRKHERKLNALQLANKLQDAKLNRRGKQLTLIAKKLRETEDRLFRVLNERMGKRRRSSASLYILSSNDQQRLRRKAGKSAKSSSRGQSSRFGSGSQSGSGKNNENDAEGCSELDGVEESELSENAETIHSLLLERIEARLRKSDVEDLLCQELRRRAELLQQILTKVRQRESVTKRLEALEKEAAKEENESMATASSSSDLELAKEEEEEIEEELESLELRLGMCEMTIQDCTEELGLSKEALERWERSSQKAPEEGASALSSVSPLEKASKEAREEKQRKEEGKLIETLGVDDAHGVVKELLSDLEMWRSREKAVNRQMRDLKAERQQLLEERDGAQQKLVQMGRRFQEKAEAAEARYEEELLQMMREMAGLGVNEEDEEDGDQLRLKECISEDCSEQNDKNLLRKRVQILQKHLGKCEESETKALNEAKQTHLVMDELRRQLKETEQNLRDARLMLEDAQQKERAFAALESFRAVWDEMGVSEDQREKTLEEMSNAVAIRCEEKLKQLVAAKEEAVCRIDKMKEEIDILTQRLGKEPVNFTADGRPFSSLTLLEQDKAYKDVLTSLMEEVAEKESERRSVMTKLSALTFELSISLNEERKNAVEGLSEEEKLQDPTMETDLLSLLKADHSFTNGTSSPPSPLSTVGLESSLSGLHISVKGPSLSSTSLSSLRSLLRRLVILKTRRLAAVQSLCQAAKEAILELDLSIEQVETLCLEQWRKEEGIEIRNTDATNDDIEERDEQESIETDSQNSDNVASDGEQDSQKDQTVQRVGRSDAQSIKQTNVQNLGEPPSRWELAPEERECAEEIVNMAKCIAGAGGNLPLSTYGTALLDKVVLYFIRLKEERSALNQRARKVLSLCFRLVGIEKEREAAVMARLEKVLPLSDKGLKICAEETEELKRELFGKENQHIQELEELWGHLQTEEEEKAEFHRKLNLIRDGQVLAKAQRNGAPQSKDDIEGANKGNRVTETQYDEAKGGTEPSVSSPSSPPSAMKTSLEPAHGPVTVPMWWPGANLSGVTESPEGGKEEETEKEGQQPVQQNESDFVKDDREGEIRTDDVPERDLERKMTLEDATQDQDLDETQQTKYSEDLWAEAQACPELAAIRTQLNVLEFVASEVQIAQARWKSLQKIIKIVEELHSYEQRIAEFEEMASDTSRLFDRRGGSLRLLEEEKFRKMAARRYPVLVRNLQDEISGWEEREGRPFNEALLGEELAAILKDRLGTKIELMHLNLNIVSSSGRTPRAERTQASHTKASPLPPASATSGSTSTSSRLPTPRSSSSIPKTPSKDVKLSSGIPSSRKMTRTPSVNSNQSQDKADGEKLKTKRTLRMGKPLSK